LIPATALVALLLTVCHAEPLNPQKNYLRDDKGGYLLDQAGKKLFGERAIQPGETMPGSLVAKFLHRSGNIILSVTVDDPAGVQRETLRSRCRAGLKQTPRQRYRCDSRTAQSECSRYI
jgi:hypothetical protein